MATAVTMLGYYMLGYYLHRIDPYAIQLWEGGPVRWYGLAYLIGFVLGYWLIRRVASVGVSTVQPRQVGDLVVSLALGAVLGGRIGYALFYAPSMIWTFQSGFPYWELLALNQGGMASHGGMIGVIVASYWYARKHRHRWAHVLDLAAFAAPLGLFFGRLANFVNGELIGRPCSAGLPWAVKFPQEMYTWDSDQLAGLAPVVDLLPRGGGSPWMTVRDWLPRVVEQVQQGNQAVIGVVEPLLTPRHPSQVYEALLEGVLLFAVLAVVWAKPRKPLVVGAVFCTVYAVVRVVGECFREPDAHIGYQWLGMTRGQWLSIGLLVVGLMLLIVFGWRRVEPMGGWRKGGRLLKSFKPIRKGEEPAS